MSGSSATLSTPIPLSAVANNTITFLQQYAIMASHGKRPDLFGNIFKKSKKKAAEPPAANSSKKPTPKK